ncbi:MAG: hypothetical protein AB1749_00670 [Pseudomonadota bacterium]
MATMNFSIPDDVKQRFNELFKDRNKSEIVVKLMRRAIEDEERRRRDVSLVERMRQMREKSPGFTAEQIKKAREDGRP